MTRWRNSLILFLVFGALAAMAAQPGPVLKSIRLEPRDVTLWGAKARQRFLVIGTFNDGMERDVTAESLFTVADPRLAAIDGGRLTAAADGETVVQAEIQGQRATARVRLEGTSNQRPFSFARDIGGILTRRGCNSTECH